MIAAEPRVFSSGMALIYSNSGYFLAGQIIERVSGLTYEEYIQQKLFAPLGMRSSAYCSNLRPLRNKVQGYARDRNDFIQGGFTDHTWPYAAGSLCASTGDVVLWLRALHGGAVISRAMYEQMLTGARLSDGTETRYGLGVYVGKDPAGHAMIGHGGAIRGFLGETRYYPENDLYVVVLQNTSGGSAPEVVADEIAERVLGRRKPQVRPQRELRDPDRYVGSYRGATRDRPGAVFLIERAGPGLTYREGDDRPIAMRSIGEDEFTADAPRSSWPYVPLVVKFRGDGVRATEMRLDSGFNHLVLRRQ